MAESATATEWASDYRSVKRIKWAWVSAADGTCTSTASSEAYDGQVIALLTDPGSTAPTDNYDIVVNDADGHDVLAGQGANRHTTTTQWVLHSDSTPLGVVAGSTLTLDITNAGDSKEGDVYVFIR